MNKTYVVIGGGSGIGKAVVNKMTSLGYSSIVIGNKKEELESLKSPGSSTVTCDISNSEQVTKVVEDIFKNHGQIDGLVNCAGKSLFQKKGEFDVDGFTALLRYNLLSAYIVTHLFGYKLIKNGGSIVNVSSIRGRTGTDSYSAGYAAAKAGVINLTKTYAIELAEKKIRVNSIAPGLTYPTGLSQHWTPEFRENITKTIPLGRLASPEEIAGPIIFLLSEDSSYITGQTLDVNGGLWMN